MTGKASALEVAESLARIGWSVFPVRNDGTKKPYGDFSWKRVATTDLDLIRVWFTADHPNSLVAVHAGRSGLHIVDVDEKGCDKKGEDTAPRERHPADCTGSGSAELDKAGYVLPETFTYRTPSGGSHHVYAAPEGADLTIAQHYPVPHVDIRAGEGYAVYYGAPL